MTKLTYNVIMLYNIDKKLSFKFFYLGGFLLRKKQAIRGSAIAPAASLAALARAEYLFTDEC